MARNPKFSINKVFDKAINVISARGYRACTMQVLIHQTQFNRRAFYLHFRNKQDFVEQLLAYYIEQRLLPLQTCLQGAKSPNDLSHQGADDNSTINHATINNVAIGTSLSLAITSFFNQYQMLINQEGCLLVKLVLELGKHNAQVRRLARQYYDSLQLAFIGTLERAQNKGELSLDTNVESMALKLSCFAQAFAVSSNLQQGTNDVQLVIETIFSKEW